MKKIFLVLMTSMLLVLSSCVKMRTYTLTFETEGGNEITPMKIKVLDPIKPEMLPTPKKDNYIFMGWFFTLEDTTVIDEAFTIVSDTKVYAKWTFDETPRVTYSIKEDVLSWNSADASFKIEFGNESKFVDKAQFDLLAYKDSFSTPTQIKVSLVKKDSLEFLFSTIVYYRDLSVIFEGSDFTTLNSDTRFEFTQTALTSSSLRMTTRNNQEAVIRLNKIDDLDTVLIKASSHHRNQVLTIVYVDQSNKHIATYPYELSQDRQEIEIDLNKHKGAVAVLITALKSTTISQTYIHDMTIIGKEKGYQFIEIKKEK